ncbi:carboxypeptidase-like regulatory domain-containing protein [Chitinophaga niabensis]|uniref:Carboxypeptidase regulatory-like domain-containing protein n=1 Tax=Chitinophaga niabensis TaxID=536979 RepID=A0A1N6EEF9_9BACT|nr:carboxypeptidase-like regulatory domain-containing protein [Chitinophaga niabensis]SIN81341.1 hypothetical protein SAMN04488055_1530 [Chitinophaga niabensis]
MRKILLLILLSAKVATAFPQQQIVVSAGGGVNNTLPAVKDKSYLGNGSNIQADVLVPFLSKANNRFTIGILAGGTYVTAKNLAPNVDKLRDEYKLYSGNLSISNAQNGSSAGFTAHLGLQAGLSLGALVLSPSISGGYFNFSQKGFAQTTTITNNGTQQTVKLSDLPEVKRTGFVTIPQLKISFPLAKTISIYTAAGLNLGPKITTGQRKLEPAGGYNADHTYEPAQLSSGKMTVQPSEINYRSYMLSAGLSFRIGGRSKRSGTADTTRNPLFENGGLSGQNPMYGQAMPGSPIGGIVVKGGKNPGGNLITAVSDHNGTFELNDLEPGIYRFTLEMPGQPQGKSISEQGVKRQESTELETRTYTGGRKNEPQGKSISEKGLKRSDTAQMALPGQPIGGIVVKGGKNPGGNLSNLTIDTDGSIRFEVLEKGNYQFLIQAGEQSNKSGSDKKQGEVKGNGRTGLRDVVKTQV